ncbi:hypothetical protein AB205_0021000 [Aquarana catesbeiana]|uniref:G-protein coupled receptors family 1 profile domain-containing protein n=1 Tax=Aquarana catesbeiana TaxID=8400 RepID=A0A2G9QF75_AQUCT|nr:hypothetical protein AB205_0021000 [Aquarana catesbeiana]
MRNQTILNELFFSGLSDLPTLQLPLFLFFLLIYLLTIIWNLLIIVLIVTDSHLHVPMYFFLWNLAGLDLCCSSVTTPRMLFDLHNKTRKISIQALMFIFYGSSCFNYFQLIGSHQFAGNKVVSMFYTVIIPLLNPLIYSLRNQDIRKAFHDVEGNRSKVFSTCIPQLTVMFIFYGSSCFHYFQLIGSHQFAGNKVVSMFYTVIIPLLNPLIYSLRNQDIRKAFQDGLLKFIPNKA